MSNDPVRDKMLISSVGTVWVGSAGERSVDYDQPPQADRGTLGKEADPHPAGQIDHVAAWQGLNDAIHVLKVKLLEVDSLFMSQRGSASSLAYRVMGRALAEEAASLQAARRQLEALPEVGLQARVQRALEGLPVHSSLAALARAAIQAVRDWDANDPLDKP